jgi:hypothetical protein
VPDLPSARAILIDAIATGALSFIRAALPEEAVSEFLSHAEGLLTKALQDRQRERDRLRRQRVERERLERERLERERIPLDQRPPICLPPVMPSLVRRTFRQRDLLQAIVSPRIDQRSPSPPLHRRSRRSSAGFLDDVERELAKLGDPARMNQEELTEHVNRIVVDPLANLSLAEVATVLRSAFRRPTTRAPREALHRQQGARNRRARSRRHRVPGRGPRAPALPEPPPEPPASPGARTPPDRGAS